MIYLDHNATTPPDPEVCDAIYSALRRDFGNPSSSHAAGKKAKETVEKARDIIAEFICCSHEEITFTSGGTESNNLALIGAAMAKKKGHIITSLIEHPSVLKTCLYLESLGFAITCVPVNKEGIVEINALRKALRDDTILISVMHANNETGVLQPLDEISGIVRDHKALFHVDAAQSIGKMPFVLKGLFIDMMTITPHKFYGPKGTGALFIRKGVMLHPLFYGAEHERGLRPGTENVAGIAGFGKTCEIAGRDMKQRANHTLHLRELLLRNLTSAFPDIVLNGHPSLRLPNTLNIRIPGIFGEELIGEISDRVAASTGSACHSGQRKPAKVLTSMGLTDEEALSSIRLSVGKDNTAAEINEASEIICQTVRLLRDRTSII